MRLSLVRAACLLFVASGLMIGCGSSTRKVEVSGKVSFPSGVKLNETDSVAVDFIPDGKAEGGSGLAKSDGSFVAKVPPGKYKVAVTIQPYPGEKDSDKRAAAFSQAVGKFDRKSTTLSYEVTGDDRQTVNIDLVKGSISK